MDRQATARLLPWLTAPAAAVALALAARVPAMAPHGILSAPHELAALTLALLAGSLARFRAGGAELPAPGLGAAALPSLIVAHGAVPAALATAVAMLLHRPAHRALAHFSGVARTGRGGWLPAAFEGAGAGALSTLAAAAVWRWLAPPLGGAATGRWAVAVAAATALYLALNGALRLARDPGEAGGATLLLPLGLDLAGLAVGLTVAAATPTSPALAVLLLAPISALAVAVARNRLLYEGTLARLGELERVHRAGHRMVAGGRELVAVVEGLHGECREHLPFAWFQFELLSPEGEARSWGASPDGRIFEGNPRPPRHPPALPGFHRRSAWRVVERELSAEEGQVARLRLWFDPRRLEPEHLLLLDNLLPQMTASVHRSLLDREARHDPLTGVPVRRVLERRLQQLWHHLREEGGAFAVILCDLDHFKRINDTFGHPTGDRALVAAARAFEGVLRSKPPQSDLLARWGGEEFVVLLAGAGGEEALQVAERLRRSIEDIELWDEGVEIPMTVSAGVAAFPDLYVESAGELLQLADGALYEAKRYGRNLCLLDLGQGRYRDGAGRLREAEDQPPPPEPPRIFS